MMRSLFLAVVLLVLFFLMIACAGDDAGGTTGTTGGNGLLITTNGRLLTVKAFPSTALGNSRDLRVYLPASYGTTTNVYPVLYLHDGQNVFAPGGPYGSWDVETAYDALATAGRIREVILVGINNNNDRIAEYTPTAFGAYGGGKAPQYLAFLTNEVMPYITTNFRVLSGPTNTAVLGSSLGGLVSFYAAWNVPGVFGMAGCLSSSFWWDNGKLLGEILAYSGAKQPVRFWIDSGNAEGNDEDGNGVTYMAEHAYAMAARLVALGWTYGTDVLCDIDYAAGHNEAAWRSRVHKPLLFFFGTRSTTVTNLTARTSSPEIDAAGTVPNVMLFVKATWADGITAEVLPYASLAVVSQQSDLWEIGTNDLITLVSGAVTGPTNIEFDVSYGGQSAQAVLAATTNLSSSVNVHLSVTTPDLSGSQIRMVGSIPALGGWNPTNGFILHQAAAGFGTKIYTNTLVVTRNTAMSFKFCAGTAWSYEELNGSGGAAGDRSFTANRTDSYYFGTVLQWRNVP